MHVNCVRAYEVYVDVHGGRVMLVSGVVQIMAVNQIGATRWAIIMSIKEMKDVLHIPKA